MPCCLMPAHRVVHNGSGCEITCPSRRSGVPVLSGPLAYFRPVSINTLLGPARDDALAQGWRAVSTLAKWRVASASGTSLPECCSSRSDLRRTAVADVHYQIVEHDGGWAYKVGDVFSEAFPTHDQARDAAERAAAEQKVPGATEPIEYQDPAGAWHEEVAQGDDRPGTDVKG